MENENKTEGLNVTQEENSALQGPISLPTNDSSGNSPVVEITAPSVESNTEPVVETSVVEVPAEPVVPDTPVIETPTVSELAVPVETEVPVVDGPSEPVQAPVEAPVVETPVEPTPEALAVPEGPATPVGPTPVSDVETSQVESAPVEVPQEPVESLDTLEAAPAVDTDNFQAQSVPSEPTATSNLEEPISPLPSLNVQPIAPALEEIEAANKPKKKKPVGLILGLLLVLIIVGAICYYKFLYLKPERAYDKVFAAYQQNVKKVLKSSVNPIEKSIMETGSVAFESNVEDLKEYKNLKVDYRFGVDLENEKIELSTNLKENDNDILETIVYLINNKMYLSSEQIYDKLLMIGDYSDVIDFSEIFENVKSKDISYVINSVNDHFISSLDNADYSSKDTKITIDEKSKSVTDNIMIINEKNIEKIKNSFLKSIKNDTKLIETLANLTDTSSDEIKQVLDQAIETKMDYGKFEVRFDVYTIMFTSKVVGVKATTTSNGNTTLLYDMVFDKNNIDVNIADYFKIKATSEDGKTFDVKVYQNDKMMFTCTITKNSEDSYTFETKVVGYAIKVTAEYKEENGDYLKNVIIDVSKDSEYIKLTVNSKTQYNYEIANVNVSNAVDVQKLTTVDKLKIKSNIEKIKKKSEFASDLLASLGVDELLKTTTIGTTTTKTTAEICKDEGTLCGKCTGNTCECEYYNTSSYKWQKITCPRNY